MIRDVFGHARSFRITKVVLRLVALSILSAFVILLYMCFVPCRSVLFVLCTCALSLFFFFLFFF
jgi:hypothetical protein